MKLEDEPSVPLVSVEEKCRSSVEEALTKVLSSSGVSEHKSNDVRDLESEQPVERVGHGGENMLISTEALLKLISSLVQKAKKPRGQEEA